MLEDRLYRKARSLEDYLDRATLKNRLRTLAVTITAHYKDSVKRRKGSSKRRSTGSVSTLSAVDTFRRSSNSTKGAGSSNEAQLLQASSSQGTGQDKGMMLSATGGNSGTAREGKDQQAESSGLTLSELTRQKAVNEELQNQILANIRQQQQIVHTRRESGTSQQGNGVSSSNNALSSGNAQENSMAMAASIVVGQQRGMPGQLDNMQNASQMQNLSGNSMSSNSRGSHFGGNSSESSNIQRNQNHLGLSASMMPNSVQAALLRQNSMPIASNTGGKFNNVSQSALLRQQSMPVSAVAGSSTDDMQNAVIQANVLERSSITNDTTSNQGDFSTQSQIQQLQAQQAAMMRQQCSGGPQGMSMNSQQQQVQMQAELVRRASQNSQFNMAQQAQMQAEFMRRSSGGNDMQAEFMRRASGFGGSSGGSLMNQQQAVAAQAQMEMMRRASAGGNQMNGLSNNMMLQAASGGVPGVGNPGMMNNQMVQAFGNNQQQFMQGNAAAMMQNMNGGMPQNMAQFSNVQQQQMNMAAAHGQGQNQGRNSIVSLDGTMQFQGKKGGDDMGVSQNTFNW